MGSGVLVENVRNLGQSDKSLSAVWNIVFSTWRVLTRGGGRWLTVVAIGLGLSGLLPGCGGDNRVRNGAILFLGDSLTARHRLDGSAQLYPEILGERWGRKVLNFSSSGLKAAEAEAKFGEKIAELKDSEVAAVFLALGANDQLSGRRAEDTAADLREIALRLRTRGWEVFVIKSIVPLRGGGYSRAYEALAKEVGTPASRDIIGSYLGKAGGTAGDNIHPSAEGHQMIAESLDRDFGRVMRTIK